MSALEGCMFEFVPSINVHNIISAVKNAWIIEA